MKCSSEACTAYHAEAATKYVRRIRNTQKRAYAEKYAAYLIETQLAEPDYGNLSYMAAQSVRISLSSILRHP